MPFGNQVLTFTTTTTDKAQAPDALGHYPEVPHTVIAPGCRHRPLAFKEMFEIGLDMSKEAWRSTLPIGEYDDDLYEQLLGIKPDSTISVEGRTFQIVAGIRPHPDFKRRFKATIISNVYVT